MKKKIAWLIGIFIMFVFLFLLTNILLVSHEKNQIEHRISKLREIPLVNLDSSNFQIPLNKDLFLIYFNSACHICRDEIQSIKDNEDELSHYNIVLVSEESIIEIKAFAYKANIENPNLFFTKINPDKTFEFFGSLSIPHVFVYGQDSVLIKEFKGANTISSILKSIKY